MFEVPRRIMAPSYVALPILAVLALVVCSVGNQLVTTCYAMLAVARNPDAGPVSVQRLRVTILLAGIAAAVIAARERSRQRARIPAGLARDVGHGRTAGAARMRRCTGPKRLGRSGGARCHRTRAGTFPSAP